MEVFNTVDEEEDINKVGFVKHESCLHARTHISKSELDTRYGLLLTAARLSSRICIVVALPPRQVTEYFSYEHFYVVFCRFYELDADRDGRLSREDLIKYGEHGLSHLIVDRYDGHGTCHNSADRRLSKEGATSILNTF